MVTAMKKDGFRRAAAAAAALLAAAAVAVTAVRTVGADGWGILAATAMFPMQVSLPLLLTAGGQSGQTVVEPEHPGAGDPILPEQTDPLRARYAIPTDNTGSELIPEENRGVIQDTFYGSGSSSAYLDYKGGNINNRTEHTAAELAEALAEPLGYRVELYSSEPQVLIYHTHTNESFDRYTAGYFDRTYPTRLSDADRNMISVGRITAEVLNAAGINTIQCQTTHDNQYNGSYQRSRASVQALLRQYPSIKVILDLHRDGIESGGVRMRPIVEIDGVPAAQFMIIAAADKENRWDYLENLRLAARVQSASAALYPGLARPVSFKYTTYNQDLAPGALLVEVGSHGNSLTEAQYTGYLLGQVLAKAFTDLAGEG